MTLCVRITIRDCEVNSLALECLFCSEPDAIVVCNHIAITTSPPFIDTQINEPI